MRTASVNKPFYSLLLSNLRKEKEIIFRSFVKKFRQHIYNENISLKYIPVRSTSPPGLSLSMFVFIFLYSSLYISPFLPQSPIFLPPSLFLLTDPVINKHVHPSISMFFSFVIISLFHTLRNPLSSPTVTKIYYQSTLKGL